MTGSELVRRVAKIMKKKRLTISVCESCTAGMLAAALTDIPGSSAYFLGGVIAYSDDVKHRIVGVSRQTLMKFGAVSIETAREMALGVRRMTHSDIAIAITGIAGPGGGSRGKPVGTVCIAISEGKRATVRRFRFKGTRQAIRRRAGRQELAMLREELHD